MTGPTIADWLRAKVSSGTSYEVRQAVLALAAELESIFPGAWEYMTTVRHCSAIGVDKASVPEPPEGGGWELVAATVTGNSFYYFWQRSLIR